MLLKILGALALAASVAACSHPEPIPVDRQPDAELLAPCERPAIPPAKPTSNETAAGWVNAVRIALECGARQAALAYFVANKEKTSAPTTAAADAPKKKWWPW